MSEVASAVRCPTCGAILPGKAPEGLCPKCLLLGAAESTDAGLSPQRPAAPSLEVVAAAFPQLEILELIGQGGMGCVFKARQPQLNRFVALKILPEALARDAAFAARFTREAQALAALSHPNIVTIHDFGEAGGFYFLLMEFVDGVNLRQALRAGRFTPEQALAVVPPICDALQFAHERGIVHRDIKPENLLLDKDGRVKIADFGIAKLVERGSMSRSVGDSNSAGEDAASQSKGEAAAGHRPAAREPADTVAIHHTAAGTPQYMAPEQRSDPQRADHRADIYSLGVVLYELLTGELPGARLQPPSRKVQIDVRLDEVVLRALEVKPELRYATAAELRTQLERAASPGAALGPAVTATVAPGIPWSDPWLAPAISLIVFFAGLMAGIFVSGALPVYRDGAYLGVVALMFCAAPLLGILSSNALRRRLQSGDDAAVASARAWLKGLGGMAFVLAIPILGFGGFFLLALIDERGGWSPEASEAVIVPLTWFGSLLLPLAGWKLFRASGAPPRLDSLHPIPARVSPWPWYLAVSAFSILAFALAVIVGWMNLRGFRQTRQTELAHRANQSSRDANAISAQQSKRERFVPQKGMENQTSWSVHPKPSFLNSNGWAVMSRMTIGGVARIQFPGEDRRRCDITLVNGNDEGITVRIDDLARKSAMTLSLRRDQPGEITLDGEGYRVLFPTTEVAASEPGISHFAHVIVTQAVQTKSRRFGTTREVELAVRDGFPRFLSFRSGGGVMPPKSVDMGDVESLEDWLNSEEVQVELRTNAAGVFLYFRDLVALLDSRERGEQLWDKASADDVVKWFTDGGFAILPSEHVSEFELKADVVSSTFHLAGRGFLQVVGFSERPARAKLRYKLVEDSSPASPDTGPVRTVDTVPPVVVQTEPASGARDVAPGETEIRVRFSKPMADKSWSWTTAWPESAPRILDGPRYEADGQTCVIKVQLEPGRSYGYWLNSDRHHNFKDRSDQPAVPYLLIFQTRDRENSF